MEGERRRRIIKLFCPSVSSKIIQIIACEEQKLDLGSIARAFGLDPNTLKLNGHFISRGVDLIASSVTWKSLIGFFSARGLSTGASNSDALLVDGKLSKIGPKRRHDPTENGILNTDDQECIRNNKKHQLDCWKLLSNDKIKGHSTGSLDATKRNWLYSSDLKRKLYSKEESHLKKLRSDHKTISGPPEKNCFTSTKSMFPCSFISKSLKRTRDDEAVVAAAPLKKTR